MLVCQVTKETGRRWAKQSSLEHGRNLLSLESLLVPTVLGPFFFAGTSSEPGAGLSLTQGRAWRSLAEGSRASLTGSEARPFHLALRARA